jgi:uncharacterized protein
MDWLFMKQWSPYAVGIGIGILSWFTFLLSDKPIGCSTAFTRTSGMLERFLRGTKTTQRPYYVKFPPTVDWEWMLVVGILVGSFVSAKLSGQLQLQWIPGKWSAAFGTALFPRLLIALMGGIIMGFGARWAGGCTSGHGISGTLQLALSSWLAAVCFFIGGIAAAMTLFTFFAS